jgi:hypothetical protein
MKWLGFFAVALGLNLQYGKVAVRKSCSTGKVAVRKKLTPDGRALANRAIALHFKRLEETFGSLTKAERHHLSAILSKLLGAVEQRAQAEGARILEVPRKTRPESQNSPAHK